LEVSAYVVEFVGARVTGRDWALFSAVVKMGPFGEDVWEIDDLGHGLYGIVDGALFFGGMYVFCGFRGRVTVDGYVVHMLCIVSK
jgi:hypothetical protein